VEDGDLLFYMSRSGAFDENNTLLKQGRVRVQLTPNPFENGEFKQELRIEEGYVSIYGKNKSVEATINIWVAVFSPAIHVEIEADRNIHTAVTYENWRFRDLFPKKRENNANSWKWAPQSEIRTPKDSIRFDRDGVTFYHNNIA